MDITKKLLSLQEISKAQLSKILNLAPHKKYLTLDPILIKPLERVCGVKWLEGNGVEKIFKLEQVCPNPGTNAVFYMIYYDARVFKQVVDQIRSQVDIDKPIKDKFHIIVVPSYPCNFENELEELGLLYNIITIHSFLWMPLHLDTGLLTLEIPDLYSSLFVYQNLTYLPTLSKCLWQLSFVVGNPKVVLALGQYSNSVLSQFDQYCENKGNSDRLESDFGALIIMDRSIDYGSALLTPGTYAALLTEVYDVTSGVCEEKQSAHTKYDQKFNPIVHKQPLKFTMDSVQDSIYNDIKNRYFTEVTSVLSNLTKQLKTEKMNSKEMALDEIKHYVQTQLQATKTKKKFITNHLQAAESIINILGHRYENQKDIEQNIVRNDEKSTNITFLDTLLNTENDKYSSLRLFCLMSMFHSLSEGEIRSFWIKFLHQFGFKYGFAFQNLISTGFLPEPLNSTSSLNLQGKFKIPKFTSSNSHINAKTLKQLPTDPSKVNLKFPICASYVFGGSYIPIIVYIASMLLNSIPLADIKSKLEILGPVSLRSGKGSTLQTRIILIYMIGGITQAEIAACNLLETLTGAQVIILTDKVITGNELMKGILDYAK